MDKPLISVIIPTHNSEATVATAIASMCRQTYSNVEIVVIDDNSTDRTVETVRRLAQDDARISCYALPFDDPHRFNARGRNINAGYMARNYGFTKIKGEWVTFQDADDASLDNRIEAQYELAQRYQASHVCIQWQRLDEALLGKRFDVDAALRDHPDAMIGREEIVALAQRTKGPIIPFLGPLNARIPFEWKQLRVINKLFFGSLESYPASGNCPLFKREILEKVQFRQLKDRIWPSFMGRGADRDFNFQVAETFKNAISFRLPLYLYRADRQNEGFEGYERYLI